MEETWRKKAMGMAMALSIVVATATYETRNSVSFQECYAGCFIVCAIQPSRTLSSCGFECLMDCIIPQNHVDDPFHFCGVGCASVRCTNISTLNNPRAKEVAGCVGSCSGVCRNVQLRI
ncbi:hypothetical protein V2J09_005253 [Rumex salicifolius]